MTTWTWRLEGADGTEPKGAQSPKGGFPNQADAESWVGEAWKQLLSQGVESVFLYRDDTLVYGPMSLRPLE